MPRLSGTHECATVGCVESVKGNARLCRNCWAVVQGEADLGVCANCGNPTRTAAATYCQACASPSHTRGPAVDLSSERAILERWHAVAARRAPAGSAWWWR